MSKLTTWTTLGVCVLLMTACGGSPNGPSGIEFHDAQLSAAASPTTNAQPSRKRQIVPVPDCGSGQELVLWLGASGRGFVEVASNYLATSRSCAAIDWQLDPGVASKELAPEPFSGSKGQGLRLHVGKSHLDQVWVIATAPDGQTAKLLVQLGGSDEETAGAATAANAQTSRRRQILPPSTCAFGQELLLQVGPLDRKFLEVMSNYRPADKGCAALDWQLDPGSAAKELAPEAFAGAKGEGLRLNPGASTLRQVWVIATTPDGQVARLLVQLAPPASDEA